jgi:hypothetical protein
MALKKLAHFSIFVEDGGKLTGTMCYAGNQSSYLLRGTMIDNRLKFTLSRQKKIIAQVSGLLTSSDADRIEGDWKEVSSGVNQKIKITYLDMYNQNKVSAKITTIFGWFDLGNKLIT